jgi:hypothetical protein
MAAVTGIISAGVALAGVGMSAAQAVKADKEKKKAQASATAAANAFKNIKETNAYSGIQVPTIGTDLASQRMNQQAMAGLGALQGTGAEGVLGGVGQLQEATNAAQLDIAAQQNEAQFNRDLTEAGAQMGIEERRQNREMSLYDAQLTGAQAAAANAQANKNAAITGMVEGSLGALGSVADATSLYKDKSSANKTLSGKKTKNNSSFGFPSEADTGLTGTGSLYDWSSSNNPTNPYN